MSISAYPGRLCPGGARNPMQALRLPPGLTPGPLCLPLFPNPPWQAWRARSRKTGSSRLLDPCYRLGQKGQQGLRPHRLGQVALTRTTSSMVMMLMRRRMAGRARTHTRAPRLASPTPPSQVRWFASRLISQTLVSVVDRVPREGCGQAAAALLSWMPCVSSDNLVVGSVQCLDSHAPHVFDVRGAAACVSPVSAGIILSAQASYRQRLNITSLCLHLSTPVRGTTDNEGQGRTPPPPSSPLAGSAAVTATATAAASTPEPEVGEPYLPPFAVPERLHGVMPTTERQHKVSEI